jgi:hypothetical protein
LYEPPALSARCALTVFAVEHVTHDAAPLGVHFALGAFIAGVKLGDAGGAVFSLRGAALRTAIGEAGLVWLQLEFFSTNDTGTDWESHGSSIIAREISGEKLEAGKRFPVCDDEVCLFST